MLIHFPLLSQLSVSAWLWGILYLLTATTLSAQTVWKPTPVAEMAYATIDEKMLYVHGGISVPNTGIVALQFFSLDLTQDSWDVSNPPWKQLPYSNVFGNTPVTPRRHALTVSQDGRRLSMWIGGEDVNKVFANYSITDNKWTQLPVTYWLEDEVRAATDPTTGIIYFPVGYGKERARELMVKADPSLRFTTETVPTTVVTFTGTPNAFVWNKLRSSFILFVDSGNAPPPAYPFYEYTPSNRQWKALNTTGPYPIRSYGSCMVAAYGGAKMIVFGGVVDGGTRVGDIYIIDMLSMTITKGQSAPVSRYSMACTVAGDNFISWGGYNISTLEPTAIPKSPSPLIYNIHSDQWVQKYVRSSSYKPSSAPSPSPTNGINPPVDTGAEGEDVGGDTKGPNGASIGGGVAAGLLALAALAFIFIRKRRQNRDQRRNSKHPEYIPHHEYNTKHPEYVSHHEHNNAKHLEYVPHHDQGLPNLRDMDTRPTVDARFKWDQIQKTPSSPQIIRNNPQGTPSSPHSTLPSPLASPPSIPTTSPLVPHLLNKSFQSPVQQTRVRSMDQHLLSIQEQIDPHKGNPQYYPIADRTPRGPQEGGEAEPASKTTTQELRYQMQLMQKELKRRNGM